MKPLLLSIISLQYFSFLFLPQDICIFSLSWNIFNWRVLSEHAVREHFVAIESESAKIKWYDQSLHGLMVTVSIAWFGFSLLLLFDFTASALEQPTQHAD